MNELYAEAGTKPRVTLGIMLLKSFLIALAVFLVILTFASSSPILMPIAAFYIIILLYIMPKFNVEYEYIFVDGQLDFDKIMGKKKRKLVIRIDFENVEIVAPEGSHALDKFRNYKVKDFSSKMPEEKPYVVIVHNGEKQLKILFNPTEKMLGAMKNKSPRKIVNY